MASLDHVAQRRQKTMMTVEHTEASSMSEVGCGGARDYMRSSETLEAE
jgi:ubiquinone/menaquinone biosynthesis C-methylase UbiE